MIYEIAQSVAYNIWKHTDYGNGGGNVRDFDDHIRMVIYEGTMPSISDYENDWSTLYYFAEGNANVGSQLLGSYIHTSGLNNNIAAATLYDSGAPTSTIYSSDGTATWAALFPGAGTQSNDTNVDGAGNTNFLVLSYMLVPVTDLAGNGIIKLSTTTVSGSMPVFGSLSLTIGV